MPKKITLISLFLIFVFINFRVLAARSHLQALQEKFPHGLLGDDYGILNENDLAVNTCGAFPKAFSPDSTSYSYWQCFETKKAKFLCDGHSCDEETQRYLTVLVVSAEKNGEYHEYISRRAISYSACQWFLKKWHHFTESEKHVCISGQYDNKDENPSEKAVSNWTFDKFKTKKGCESYFFGGCSLKYQMKNGCKLQE